MELSVENLCGLLVRSKLLPADEVKALYQRWKSEAKEGHADVGPFSQWLAAGEHLNKFQAALLTSYVQCAAKGAPVSVTERTPGPAPSAAPFDFGVPNLQPRDRRTKDTPQPKLAEVDTVDVELVEGGTPPGSPAAAKPSFRLSLRDWLMMGLGAGAVIATVIAGMLAARWGG